MIQLDQIKGYFPAELQASANYDKYMLKEYIQLMILDFLSTSPWIEKVVFIGGTNLRFELLATDGDGDVTSSGEVKLGISQTNGPSVTELGTNESERFFEENLPEGTAPADGSLTKDGAGVLTLTGANTYSGGTAVDAGILRLTDKDAAGAGV